MAGVGRKSVGTDLKDVQVEVGWEMEPKLDRGELTDLGAASCDLGPVFWEGH